MTRVVGLDLSLTATGVATIDQHDPQQPPRARVTTVRSSPPAVSSERLGPLGVRSLRLRTLAGSVTAACSGADLVVVEGPTYAATQGSAHDRAGMWWLIVARLTGHGLNVVEVSPPTVKVYGLGKGAGAGTGKDDVLAAVVRRYDALVQVRNNNEADALLLAAMGARFTGHPVEPPGQHKLPRANLRAMDSVRWIP